MSVPALCLAHPKTLPLACQVFLDLIDTRPGSHIRDTCGVASKDLYEVAGGARAAAVREKAHCHLQIQCGSDSYCSFWGHQAMETSAAFIVLGSFDYAERTAGNLAHVGCLLAFPALCMTKQVC